MTDMKELFKPGSLIPLEMINKVFNIRMATYLSFYKDHLSLVILKEIDFVNS